MNYPKVSIIIVNWNGLEDTIECLESLKKITYPNYRIIVIDNGSEGNDAQTLMERFADYIKLIRNDRNYGYAKGVNTGIVHALKKFHPDYLLLLNNDTVVAPDFLGEMTQLAETDVSIGILGPKIYHYDSPNIIQCIGSRMNMWTGEGAFIAFGQVDRGQYDSQKEIGWVGPCGLLRASVVKDVGLYDESYFVYWEDVDYCTRAKKAGYKIMYAPTARIWHKLEKSSRDKMGFVEYYIASNRFRFMKKNATKCQYLSFLFYFFGYHIWLVTGSRIYRKKMKQLPSFYRGVRDGLFNSLNIA